MRDIAVNGGRYAMNEGDWSFRGMMAVRIVHIADAPHRMQTVYDAKSSGYDAN
ncbi:hypothetical protein [Bifidobacterium longum]|uniref:hypothetical protein n=1 Tax=Bifidobacterium longum TaxID=216816 RepID=UPI001F5A74E0|nr:hypothetical protein [Bifidobacterium longum]